MDEKKIPKIKRLSYKNGELIIKEGGYGICVYKIIKGSVQIFKEAGGREIPLATLGPGEIIGEMTFLGGPSEPRSASAKALEDSELEVWHFSNLRKEYEQMPRILKYMATQSLRRLIRTNNMLVSLNFKRKKTEKLKERDPWASHRLFYRKEVDLECVCRPNNSSPQIRLRGVIKNISLNGMRLEMSVNNGTNFPHEPGEVFAVSTVLPNGKNLDLTAEIISVSKDLAPGRISLGMRLNGITAWARKTLGFFLLP
jgi:CRP-like cAMP-binding protein